MSLATRCAACGTVFRVVQDQLRVSSGWVRCGRCGEVFNAIESLVDLEIDRPGEGAPPSVHGARVMEDLARVAGRTEPDSLPTSRPEANLGQSGDGAAEPRTSLSMPEGKRSDLEPAVTASDGRRDDHRLASSDEAADSAAERLHARSTNLPPQSSWDEGADLASTAVAPAFVRRAERAARWRHPAVRAALWLIVGLAGITLGWQASLTHHDWLAARWPALAPIVATVCVVGGCSIEAPRRIDSLAVDSSGLVRSGTSPHYRLSLVLRNRDALTLQLPAIDLSLTDAGGGVLARRVLAVTDLGVEAAEIAAGADLAMAATLEVNAGPVVGYTIELFYP